MASLAIAPFRSLLEDRLTQLKKDQQSFIQITSAVLLNRKKFLSDIQLIAYLWAHALTSSRQCLGQDVSDWSDVVSITEWSSMLECSEKQAFNILKDAADRGVILRKEIRGRGFKYRPCAQAELATVPLPVPPDRTPPPPPADDDQPEEEEEQNLAEAVQIKPFTIAARRKTRKIELETAVSGFKCDNLSGRPLTISGHALKGVLLLRVDAQEGEEKGMSHSNRLHGSTSDTRAARQDLRDALDVEFYVPLTGGPVENELWPKVAEAAGPDLPIEAALNFFRRKTAIFNRQRKEITPGLSISWMSFARSSWEHAQRSPAPVRKTAPAAPSDAELSKRLEYDLFRERWASEEYPRLSAVDLEQLHADTIAELKAMRIHQKISKPDFNKLVDEQVLTVLSRRAPSMEEWSRRRRVPA